MRKKIILFFILIFLAFSSSVLGASADSIKITSPVGLLIEESTGKILYEKSANEKMYPASTTKIMTALLTLEKGNLSDTVVVSKKAVSSLEGGYVTSYIAVGEELTVEQLLNVLLVPSGNVAGNVLAEYVSGSVDNFVSLMNSRAKELGCNNTHFTNSYGLHDDNHYSTAYDLYLMAREAMKHQEFRDIVSKSSYSLAPTNKHLKDDRTLPSTNDMLKPTSRNYYQYAIGIKTGYTSKAQECLVSAATKDNMTLYAVILGSERNDSGTSSRYTDITKLFNFGFNNYLFRTIKSKGTVIDTVKVNGATSDTKNLELTLDSTITAFIHSDDTYTSFTPNIVVNELSAPIAKDTVVGTISYEINGSTYTSNIVASTDVEKSYMFIFVDIGIVIAIMILLKCVLRKRKKKNRRR